VTEVDGSGEDDVTRDEDWVWLGASISGVDFAAYVSVDQELAACAVYGRNVWWKWKLRRGGAR
jgi:hypothetical protein